MSDRVQGPRAAKTSRMSVTSYRKDSLYPRIVRAVEPLLASRKVVAPVDVLIGIGLLTPAKLEDWRFGRVPYLEKVIDGNLAKLSRVLRILRFHAHDLNLRPSTTAYMRWGKGPKQRLCFTKTADRKLEEAYSLNFIRPGNGRDEVEEGSDDVGTSL